MKRKLIDTHQEFLIVCDNKQCDFKIENISGDPNEDTRKYINMPCPICRENLLTEEDYKQGLKVLKAINWLNKWFSWLTIFSSKKENKDNVVIHCHNGVMIEKNENERK